MSLTVASAIACLSPVGLANAEEAKCATRQPVEIPAETLGLALQSLAENCRLQLVYVSAEVEPFRTNGLSGVLTLDEALSRLLSGTGLTYSRSGDSGLVISANVVPASHHHEGGARSEGAAITGSEGGGKVGGASVGWAHSDTSAEPEPAQTSIDQIPSRQEARTSHKTPFARLAGILAAAFATAAVAQTGSVPSAAELSEVVVTGSRVITNGNDSPTPLTVVTLQELQATQSSTVTQGLMHLPQFSGSRGATITTPGTPGPNNGAIAALSLEGLGPARTLILYDGHRVPATQQNGLINANTIPQMLLERVDIVTGGASAVYGSDAIGGVVNFVTNKTFNGIKADLQAGISQKRLNATHKIEMAFGTSLFDGRGHIEGSFESEYDQGVVHRNSIYGDNTWTIFGNGTAQFPYFLANHGVNTALTYGGKIVGPTARNPLLNYTFNTNGVLTPFVLGTTPGPVANNTNLVGGDGVYFEGSTLTPRETLNQLYARFDFNVSDNLHYYLSAAGTVDAERGYNNDTNIMNVNISSSSAFLPASVAQQLQTAGLPTFSYSYAFGPDSGFSPQGGNFSTRSLYINTGMDGKLAQYSWDVAYTRSNVTVDNNNFSIYNNGRLFAALDAVVNPANGQIVCNVTLTNPGLYPGCVPINLFGPTASSPAAQNYIYQIQTFRSHLPTDDVSASISGAVFNDWAGPVRMAASANWRAQGFRLFTSQPTVNLAPLDCTGLRFGNCTNPSATNPGTPQANQASAPRPPVSESIYEGALEANAPLLRNMWMAKALNLDLAYRYAKYSINGNADILAPNYDSFFHSNTWKAGVDWHLNDAVTLRATRSRDFRAPNLNDLYAPQSVTQGNGNVDFWTNSNPLAQLVVAGNSALKPEVAYTTTVGTVLRPTDNFSLAVDYFNVTIANYISTIVGNNGTIQQACYASGGSSNYCSLIFRPQGSCYSSPSCSKNPAVNAATQYNTFPLNTAVMQTQGVNLEANYKMNLFGRPLALRALAAYQPHLLLNQPAVPTQDTAGQVGSNSPRIRVTVNARYATDKVGINWQTRWRDSLHYTSLATQVALDNTGASSMSFSDMTLTYDLSGPFSGASQVFLNVQNVFNQIPPVIGGGSFPVPQGAPPGDWPYGRYFTLGMHFKM